MKRSKLNTARNAEIRELREKGFPKAVSRLRKIQKDTSFDHEARKAAVNALEEARSRKQRAFQLLEARKDNVANIRAVGRSSQEIIDAHEELNHKEYCDAMRLAIEFLHNVAGMLERNKAGK
jgi:hypothetical protein